MKWWCGKPMDTQMARKCLKFLVPSHATSPNPTSYTATVRCSHHTTATYGSATSTARQSRTSAPCPHRSSSPREGWSFLALRLGTAHDCCRRGGWVLRGTSAAGAWRCRCSGWRSSRLGLWRRGLFLRCLLAGEALWNYHMLTHWWIYVYRTTAESLRL